MLPAKDVEGDAAERRGGVDQGRDVGQDRRAARVRKEGSVGGCNRGCRDGRCG